MRLEDFKGMYGGAVFLCGSGASWLRIPLPLRKGLALAYTFAGARFFRWAEAGFTPSFYLVAEERHASEWKETGFGQTRATIARFCVDWQPVPAGWVMVPRPPSLSFHHYTLPESRLSPFEGECRHIHMAHDVPLAMLQVARYMGFSEFYLVGCECTAQGYAWNPEERRSVGDRGGTMFSLYAKAYEEVGGKLYDCTPGGLLSTKGVLPHVDLEDALAVKVG